MPRQITEKLREQWRIATRKYREERRKNGLKIGWVKKDKINYKKMKEITEYIGDSMSHALKKSHENNNNYYSFKKNGILSIKKMSESLNLPVKHFKHKDTLNDFIEYQKTGNLEIELSGKAKKLYLEILKQIS